MTQGGYQVIMILPIKSKMAAAKKQRLISLSRTDIIENMREKLLIKSNF